MQPEGSQGMHGPVAQEKIWPTAHPHLFKLHVSENPSPAPQEPTSSAL